MNKQKPKLDKQLLIGRDPAKGRLSFKTGVIKTKKDKMKNRNSKQAREEKKKDLEE